jgi:mannose-6-phosphate isomerase-like protein (cupin superfamily)
MISTMARAITAVMTSTAALLSMTPRLAAQGQPATPPQWSAAPAILPPGARIAVISGDPTLPGRSTIELWMPDGYQMPPHYHPMDESLEVKQGTLLVGMGDKFDAAKTMPVAVGDTGTAPAGMHHFSVARGETIIAVIFMGPYIITYVHAYDLPQRHGFPFGS